MFKGSTSALFCHCFHLNVQKTYLESSFFDVTYFQPHLVISCLIFFSRLVSPLKEEMRFETDDIHLALKMRQIDFQLSLCSDVLVLLVVPYLSNSRAFVSFVI